MACNFTWAQTQDYPPLFDPQQKKYETSLEKYYKDRSIIRLPVTQVLETELDSMNYLVGPGDQFKLTVFGEIEKEINFEILPEGTIILPTIGELKVNGKSLCEAKKIIIENTQKYYVKSNIAVNIVGLRRFRIYLTGEVNKPGTYFAQGSDRLSDIIEIAEGITDWADDTQIEIRHEDSTRQFCDLTQFYLYGDKGQNPSLKGGDIIYIKSININDSYVIVEGTAAITSKLEGEVKAAAEENLLGIYPLRKDENLYQFLLRIGALSKKADLETIRLIRDNNSMEINLLEPNTTYFSFKLKHRDKIYIPPLINRVFIQGEVKTPGALGYYANYTAIDYVGMAGALETAVSPKGYIIIRSKTGQKIKGGDTIIEKGDTIIVEKKGREVIKDLFSIITPVISLAISVILLSR